MAKNYVCLYHSYLDAIQALGDAERGRLLTAMLEYSITGAAGHLGGNERFIFPLIKAQIDRDQERYENLCRTNAENGSRGGRGKAVASGRKRSQAVANEKSQGEGEGEGKGKEEGEREGEEGNEETTPPDGGVSKKGPASGPFCPPTLAEVEAYRAERQSPVIAQEFIDFYAAKGWMVGKCPMKDWKAAFRNAEKWDRWQKPAQGKTGMPHNPTARENYAPTPERIKRNGQWLDEFLQRQREEQK